jgi:DNA-binding GntR family transcriptional regulator
MPLKITELRNSEQPGVEPRLYMQVAEVVRRKIDSGELKSGDAVSIANLKEAYGVSRDTASKGLCVLCKEGQMKRWPGIGYVVMGRKADCLV